MTTPVRTVRPPRWIARSTFAAKASAPLLAFRRDARGATAIEYSLIAGLISVAIIGGLNAYGNQMNLLYDVVKTAVTRN